MNGNSDDKNPGLGKLVYSVEEESVREGRKDSGETDDVIQEASEESFPASDPPGYAKGATEETTIEPGSQAATENPPHTEALRAMTEHDQPDRKQ